ncbi:hypothetical protein C805_03711 [Eubacterium sp. 14-2]|uniref:hypothetical protein n=1 Tax=Eubacterium sp. 14-2 TaxID=1235790 RepID=UPI0003379E2D|nr:hypothetical protein [Eubacterium sp. 14-2]EOT21633.1 hypothetical protein C805_03711 [Eubacterium sp. 14-2]
MRVKYKKHVLLFLTMMCMSSFSVRPVFAQPQGTNGTELQVAQPEQLEIQLGAEWAGVEFQMKTDAGLYPDTIPVGQDGVLRLEIGGSKEYVLTCMNSSAKAPSPTQAPATTESPSEEQSEEIVTEQPEEITTEQPEEITAEQPEKAEDALVAGIPVLHLCLFIGGMILAVGGLVTMHIIKRRREDESGYEYDEEEEE